MGKRRKGAMWIYMRVGGGSASNFHFLIKDNRSLILYKPGLTWLIEIINFLKIYKLIFKK